MAIQGPRQKVPEQVVKSQLKPKVDEKPKVEETRTEDARKADQKEQTKPGQQAAPKDPGKTLADARQLLRNAGHGPKLDPHAPDTPQQTNTGNTTNQSNGTGEGTHTSDAGRGAEAHDTAASTAAAATTSGATTEEQKKSERKKDGSGVPTGTTTGTEGKAPTKQAAPPEVSPQFLTLKRLSDTAKSSAALMVRLLGDILNKEKTNNPDNNIYMAALTSSLEAQNLGAQETLAAYTTPAQLATNPALAQVVTDPGVFYAVWQILANIPDINKGPSSTQFDDHYGAIQGGQDGIA